MNSYELMVIFTPVLSEEDFKASQKKYSDLIAELAPSIADPNANRVADIPAAMTAPAKDAAQSIGDSRGRSPRALTINASRGTTAPP